LKIKGESTGPQGKIDLNGQSVTGLLKLPLEELSTGISMRDEHMKKKYLEVEKFPAAELNVTKMDLPKGADGTTTKDVPFTGELFLHGVKKTITGKADVTVQGGGYKVNSSFTIALSDYKIDIPSYAGIKVANDVTVNVDFAVAQK
jgi:polyisoprenoid-binding protein YceI